MCSFFDELRDRCAKCHQKNNAPGDIPILSVNSKNQANNAMIFPQLTKLKMPKVDKQINFVSGRKITVLARFCCSRSELKYFLEHCFFDIINLV